MGISVVRYRTDSSAQPCWGVLNDGHVHVLNIDTDQHIDVMQYYFADPNGFRRDIAAQSVGTDAIEWLSPVSKRTQLFCQGLNYADHRSESGLSADAPDTENLIFMKSPSSICGPNDAIVRPAGCKLLDYEIELALVLRRDITAPCAIGEKRLKDYVGALVMANDVSARDVMFGAPMLQWFKGKSARTFCPMGPVLYLMDEQDFDRLYDLRLTLTLNGVVRQQASTAQLIHKPAKTLSDISAFSDLNAGDCVLTGTPGGVLAGANLKAALAIVLNMRNDALRRQKFTRALLAGTKFLQAGDVLELKIQSSDGSINLGMQANRIVDED